MVCWTFSWYFQYVATCKSSRKVTGDQHHTTIIFNIYSRCLSFPHSVVIDRFETSV